MSTGRLRVNISNIDAQYCFTFGHCNNTEVTENTTIAEMERMCDAKFGHQHWTTDFHMMSGLGFPTLGSIVAGKVHPDLRHPMHITIDRKFSSSFAELARA